MRLMMPTMFKKKIDFDPTNKHGRNQCFQKITLKTMFIVQLFLKKKFLFLDFTGLFLVVLLQYNYHIKVLKCMKSNRIKQQTKGINHTSRRIFVRKITLVVKSTFFAADLKICFRTSSYLGTRGKR